MLIDYLMKNRVLYWSEICFFQTQSAFFCFFAMHSDYKYVRTKESKKLALPDADVYLAQRSNFLLFKGMQNKVAIALENRKTLRQILCFYAISHFLPVINLTLFYSLHAHGSRYTAIFFRFCPLLSSIFLQQIFHILP